MQVGFGLRRRQVVVRQFAARFFPGFHAAGFAHVGHRGEMSLAVDAEPGSIGLEIASGKSIGVIPPVRVARGLA